VYDLRLRCRLLFLAACGRIRKLLNIDPDERNIPVSKSAHTFCQIAPSLKLGVDDYPHVDFGKSMTYEGSKMLWESSKGIITALESDVG
jgi:hypothetical protein